MKLTNNIEVNGKTYKQNKFYLFSDQTQTHFKISQPLSLLLEKSIEFSDKSLLSEPLLKDLYTDLFLNTYNKCVLNYSYTKENYDADEYNKSLEDIYNNTYITYPLRPDFDESFTGKLGQYLQLTYRKKRKVLDALNTVGLFDIKVGEFLGKLTTIKLKEHAFLSDEFLDFLRATSTESEIESIVCLTVMMSSVDGLKFELGRFDWNQLETRCPSAYASEQATVAEIQKDRLNRPLAKLVTCKDDKESRSKSKYDSKCSSIDNSEWDKLEQINKGFKSDYTSKYFYYYKTTYQYNDVITFSKDGLSPLQSGRATSAFTNIKRDQRQWLTDSLDLVSVDVPSAQFTILYEMATGKKAGFRLYNKVAEQIVNDKSMDLGEDREFFINKTAELLKQSIMRPFNVKNKKGAMVSIKEQLHKDALICPKEITFKHLDKNSWDFFKKVNELKIKERNTAFLAKYGVNEENQLYLDLLGRKRFTAKAIIKAVETCTQEIKHYLYRENWGSTQYIESQALINTVLPEMIKDGLSPFSSYDGVYVPKKLESKYENLFSHALSKEINLYMASRLEELIEPENIVSNIDTILKMNSRNYRIEDIYLNFTKPYADYMYLLQRGSDNIIKPENLSELSIFTEKDLVELENLSNTSEKLVKSKITNYINHSNNFDLHKLIISMYIYALKSNKTNFKLTNKQLIKSVVNNNTHESLISKSLVLLNNSIKNYSLEVKNNINNFNLISFNKINNFFNHYFNLIRGITYVTESPPVLSGR